MQCFWFSSPVLVAPTALKVHVSGTGEHIVRALLARAIGRALSQSHGSIDVHEVLRKVLVDEFCSESNAFYSGTFPTIQFQHHVGIGASLIPVSALSFW